MTEDQGTAMLVSELKKGDEVLIGLRPNRWAKITSTGPGCKWYEGNNKVWDTTVMIVRRASEADPIKERAEKFNKIWESEASQVDWVIPLPEVFRNRIAHRIASGEADL